MENTPDRDNVIELLEQLGEPDDVQALSAARNLHGIISGSGLTWDDLLVPDGEATTGQDHYGDEEFDDADEGKPDCADEVVPTGEAAADIKNIVKLLERKDISAALREELEGYKEDIEEGDFTASDRQYLSALQKRLSGSSKKRTKAD